MTGPNSVFNQTQFQVAPSSFGFLSKGQTSLNVEALTYGILSNVGAVTITEFKRGQPGQVIKVLGDGFTSIANNSSIKTNTGALKLLLADSVYTFTCFGTYWVEDAL